MKNLLFTSFLFIVFAGFSQTIPPPYINYQAVLYDVNGANPNTPLSNQSFSTFVNINDELGNLVYQEEHYVSTDANGLITIRIGDGIYLAGTIINFNQINWNVGKYFLVIDFDINGTISSTAPEQLVTVPYSFYAGNAGNGISSIADNGNGTLTFTYLNGTTYITPMLNGILGTTGPAGTNGLNALIKTTTEPVGANCANGGTKIETGLDVNGSGVLDAGEVNSSQTKYICNGINGLQGVNGGNTSPNLQNLTIAMDAGVVYQTFSMVNNNEIWNYSLNHNNSCCSGGAGRSLGIQLSFVDQNNNSLPAGSYYINGNNYPFQSNGMITGTTYWNQYWFSTGTIRWNLPAGTIVKLKLNATQGAGGCCDPNTSWTSKILY
jgi:hypothetical protein